MENYNPGSSLKVVSNAVSELIEEENIVNYDRSTIVDQILASFHNAPTNTDVAKAMLSDYLFALNNDIYYSDDSEYIQSVINQILLIENTVQNLINRLIDICIYTEEYPNNVTESYRDSIRKMEYTPWALVNMPVNSRISNITEEIQQDIDENKLEFEEDYFKNTAKSILNIKKKLSIEPEHEIIKYNDNIKTWSLPVDIVRMNLEMGDTINPLSNKPFSSEFIKYFKEKYNVRENHEEEEISEKTSEKSHVFKDEFPEIDYNDLYNSLLVMLSPKPEDIENDKQDEDENEDEYSIIDSLSDADDSSETDNSSSSSTSSSSSSSLTEYNSDNCLMCDNPSDINIKTIKISKDGKGKLIKYCSTKCYEEDDKWPKHRKVLKKIREEEEKPEEGEPEKEEETLEENESEKEEETVLTNDELQVSEEK